MVVHILFPGLYSKIEEPISLAFRHRNYTIESLPLSDQHARDLTSLKPDVFICRQKAWDPSYYPGNMVRGIRTASILFPTTPVILPLDNQMVFHELNLLKIPYRLYLPQKEDFGKVLRSLIPAGTESFFQDTSQDALTALLGFCNTVPMSTKPYLFKSIIDAQQELLKAILWN